MPAIGLLSDTHGTLPSGWELFFQDCDEIWHAGDIGDVEILNRLSAFKPLKAVYGNIDGQQIRGHVSDHLLFNVGGMRVLLKHIAGKPGNYYPETKSQIAAMHPNLLVCGHSHILLIHYSEINRLMHINPGAAGNSGFHTMQTMLRFEINHGSLSNMEIWEKHRRKTI